MGRVSKRELEKTVKDLMDTSDLSVLTPKQIRLYCEKKYKVDLTSQIEDINQIVLRYVNYLETSAQTSEAQENFAQAPNIVEESESCSENDQSKVLTENDEAYARQLLGEDFNLRPRSLSKRPPSPTAADAKTSKKVAPEKRVMGDAGFASEIFFHWTRKRNDR